MSDSDSDDNFACLITKGEENFWKSYQTDSKTKIEKNDNTISEASTSSGRTEDKPNKHIFQIHISKNKRSLSDSEDSDSTTTKIDETTTILHQNKKANIPRSSSSSASPKTTSSSDEDTKETEIEKQSSSNLLNSILKTLSKPTTPPPEELEFEPKPGPSKSFNTNKSNKSKSKGPVSARTLRSSKRNVAKEVAERKREKLRERQLREKQSLSPLPPPFRDTYNLDESINSVARGTCLVAPIIDSDPSKTPPRSSPSDDYLNRVIDVKILWKSFYSIVFKVRRFTPLKGIIEHFAAKENVDPKHICFSINDRMVNLNVHSCVTLRYKPHEEIEGGVLDCDFESKISTSKCDKGVKLKLRLDRQLESIVMEDNLNLVHLYAQVVIKFQLVFGRFQLEFDGKIIACSDTIKDLGLEHEDCIDILLI